MFKNFQNYFWSSQRSIISIMKKNFKIFQSERFQICRHSSSKILCDVVLEALQATHLLQSSQAILHHVPFFVLSSSWKNCLQNMVVFVNQTSSQIMDSTVSKSLFRISIVVFLCINIKVANETVWWIRAFPRFYASFRGSQGHILSSKVFPRKESLLLRLKHFETACNPFLWHLRLNREATDFKQLFMVFMSTWQLCSLVTQVQILCIFREAVSWENLLHRWTSKRKIFWPLWINFW